MYFRLPLDTGEHILFGTSLQSTHRHRQLIPCPAKHHHPSNIPSFDTIKTRLQCGPIPTPSALSVLRSILAKEGVRGLYKGATPPALGWSAIDGVLLGSLHNYRLFLAQHAPMLTEDTPGKDVRRLGLLGHGLAGGAAGLTRCVESPHSKLWR